MTSPKKVTPKKPSTKNRGKVKPAAKPHTATPARPRRSDTALAKWAEDPTTWGQPHDVLRGDAAAQYGRSILQAAGVDLAAVERAGGRPRVNPHDSAPRGVRSPRVNVAITQAQARRLEQLARERGRTRSDLVRDALDTYLGTSA